MTIVDKLMLGALLALLLFLAIPMTGVDPGDNPGKPPIAGKGLRVLFIEETADLAKYPKDQRYIAQSTEVSSYLNQRCAKESSGQPAWRLFDPNQDLANETKSWQDAMKLPHEPLPWLMVSDGRKGVSRPLPKTLGDTMVLLRKYGGR